jgi:hypothetical protein
MANSETDTQATALGQMDRFQTFFGRVEAKASFLLAIDLALLGSVAVAIPVKDLVSAAGVTGLIAATFLAFSLVNLYAAFYPHLNNPRTSLIYFADIAGLTADEYKTKIRAASPKEMADDALCQVWRNAQILDKKFKRSRSAFLLTAAALPFWIAVLSLATLRSGAIPGLE